MSRVQRRLMKKQVEKRLAAAVCGECTACCTVMRVPTLDKAAGVACQHEHAGVGCAAYGTRPNECRNFYCLWRAGLLDKILGGVQGRPDQLGLLFDVTRGAGEQMLVVRPVWDGALDEAGNQDVLRRLVDAGHLIYIVNGEQRRIVGPAEKVRRAQEFARRVLPTV